MTPSEETDSPKAGGISKIIVLIIALWIVGFMIFAVIWSRSPAPSIKTVVSPFKPWDGEWEGESTTTVDGKTVTKSKARLQFRHINAEKNFRQEGHADITDESGKAESGEFIFTADYDCKNLVRRVLTREGRRTDDYQGKAEGDVIVWSRDIPGTTETFRQWVEGDTLHVEGSGVYAGPAGEEKRTYSATYKKVPTEAAAEEAKK